MSVRPVQRLALIHCIRQQCGEFSPREFSPRIAGVLVSLTLAQRACDHATDSD